MARETNHLASVLLAGQLLGVVASRAGVSVSALRTLGLVAALGDNERVVGSADIARLIGHVDLAEVQRKSAELRRAGLLEVHRHGRHLVGWRVLPAGAVVLGLLAREERATRARVSGTNLRRWPRAYRKSAAWYAARGKVPRGEGDNEKPR